MLEKIQELVENKKYSQVKELLIKMNEHDIAEIMEELPPKERIRVFRL